MIYLDMKFRSEALSGNAQLSLLLPDGAESFKTLWLLHGLYGDHTSWMRNSSIERYAAQYGIAVVMPNAQNSWYADTAFFLHKGQIRREIFRRDENEYRRDRTA